MSKTRLKISLPVLLALIISGCSTTPLLVGQGPVPTVTLPDSRPPENLLAKCPTDLPTLPPVDTKLPEVLEALRTQWAGTYHVCATTHNTLVEWFTSTEK